MLWAMKLLRPFTGSCPKGACALQISNGRDCRYWEFIVGGALIMDGSMYG